METGLQAPLAQRSVRPAFYLFAAALLVSLLLRVFYLMDPTRVDFRIFSMLLSDEGAHGIMALHILRGARPVFYYGAYYLGSLDAYFTALLFDLIGPSLAVLRSSSTLFSLACVPLVYLIATKLFSRRAAFLAAAIAVLPSVYIFVWGSFALCAYCSYTFFVLVLLYGLLLVLERPTVPRLVMIGMVAGLAAWNNQLTFPAIGITAAALYFWVRPSRRQAIALAIAFVVGVSPLIYGNIIYPFATGRRIAAKVLFSFELTESFVKEEKPESERTYKSIPLLQVLGAQPGRDGSWSVIGIFGSLFLGIGFLGALWQCFRSRHGDPIVFRRYAVTLAFAAAFLLVGAAGFAAQPIGRYQIPLYPILAILAAGWIDRVVPRFAVGIVGFLLLAQAIAIAMPVTGDGTPARESILTALRSRGLTHGYGAGPMYDLVFRSLEDVIIVPLDHSRYLPYESQVAAAPQIFYLYRDDQRRKPAHLSFLEQLSRGNVEYEQMDIGTHHVLFGFQPREVITAQAIAQVRKRFRGGGEE